jgi:hypothetical protein
MRTWTRLINSLFSGTRSRPRNSRNTQYTCRFRPRVHELEDRMVPSGSDMFATASVLTGSFTSATGSNDGATGEIGEPLPTADANPLASVWWQWTAPTTGTAVVNTCGSDFDTILGVYTGSVVNALTPIDVNDDDELMIPQSQITFAATAGTTYHFVVDGYGGATGNIALNVAIEPANDNFANATPFTGTSMSGWNLAATGEPGEPIASPPTSPEPLNTVWWTWTAPASGPVVVDTQGCNFDTILAVYTGSSVDNLTTVAVNDDYYADYTSRVDFNAVAGTTYHFAVDGSLFFTGCVDLNMPICPAPSNHAPVIGSQSLSVSENTPVGTVVGSVAASDPDAGQTLTYAITGGNIGGAFAINATTGVLTVANPAVLNYETNPTIGIAVQVTDSGSPAMSATTGVIVHLNDVNETPVFALNGPYSINENTAAATPVGLALATDPDAGQTLSYSIIGGNTGGAFTINPSNGLITVANQTALNFETTPSYTLKVQVTDSGSPAISVSTFVPINLVDVNEAPVISNQNFSTAGNSPAGTAVGTVAASDPDNGQTLSFSITAGNETGSFAINAATGQITVANQAALASLKSAVLTVQATDNGSPKLSASASISITVTPVNVVLSAQQQINLLVNNVQTLLGSGQDNSLQSSLSNAQAKLDQGNTTAGVNNLQAFINKTQALVQSGKLSAANGQSLINAAKLAIASAQS